MDISEILTKLDSAGFEDTDEADKIDAINDTIWDIESRAQWPFLEKSVALNFDGSSPTPTNVPADFKHVMWISDTTNGISLWPERLSTVRDRHGSQVSLVQDPSIFYFLGDEIRFWPVPPASTGRYQMDYFASQPEVGAATVEADLLMPRRHHKAILFGTLQYLYEIEDDPEQAAVFERRYDKRIETMHEDLLRRQFQRADQIYVIDEDDIW